MAVIKNAYYTKYVDKKAIWGLKANLDDKRKNLEMLEKACMQRLKVIGAYYLKQKSIIFEDYIKAQERLDEYYSKIRGEILTQYDEECKVENERKNENINRVVLKYT
jgi:hypothetical protein